MVSPYRPYVAPKPQGPTQGNTGNPMAAQNFGGGWGTTAANPYGWSQVQSPKNQGHAPAPGSETYAAPKSPPMYDTMMPARPQQGAQQATPASTGKPGWDVMMPQRSQPIQQQASGMMFAGGQGGSDVLNQRPQATQAQAPTAPDIASMLSGSTSQASLPGYGLWGLGSSGPGYLGQQGMQAPQTDIERQMYPYGLAGSGGGTDAPDFGMYNSQQSIQNSPYLNDAQRGVSGKTPQQIMAERASFQIQQGNPSGSGPGGGAASPPPAPGAGGTSNMTGSSPQNTSNLLNIQTVNQETAPIYPDQMIQQNRNQVLANMARVTPESAAKQFETPGMSRSAGTWSAALPKLANFQAGELGNLANQEYGFRNANATNQLDQQYRREMEGLGLANNEFGLQNAYGDMQDQARQRQINLLMSMLQGAGRLNTLGSYGSGY